MKENTGVIILILTYIIGSVCAAIGSFMISVPMGLFTVAISLIFISIVLYKELNNERSS